MGQNLWSGGAVVIGAGYVGLTLSAFLASKGVRTTCVEKDHARAERIRRGEAPIHEEGLQELLRRVVDEGTLNVRAEMGGVLENSHIVFITVGTPTGSDYIPDLSQVQEASRQIGEALKSSSGQNPLIVVKSTVPPGTTWNVVRPIIEAASGRVCGEGFHLCSNPEFLREGSALHDTMNPDRIVIGAKSLEAAEALKSFYDHLYTPRKIATLITTPTNAELIKLATNTYLALKISFINLISNICESLNDADVGAVAEGLGLDPRIGPQFLRAGLGFGGSCLPKDTRAMRGLAASLGVDTSLIDSILEINKAQRTRVVERLSTMLGGLAGRMVAVLGLSFKPGTDDVRESPSIEMVRELLSRGAEVRVHDPKALNNAKQVLESGVTYCKSVEECLMGVDAAIIATEWPEYSALNPQTARSLMRNPLIIDGRRILDHEQWASAGVKVYKIGLRGPDG
ncbi:MAG: UDP-glucose/GDP-mannose dehydrogenase family protein [Nitrososphaerota archaeon]